MTDSATLLCSQGDVESVLSVLGLALALDDDRSGSIASSPESTYLADCIKWATAECVGYLARRYEITQLSNSDSVREAVAVRAAVRARRHRTNPTPEGLEEWSDEIMEWYEKVRKGDVDLGMIPEASPSRPGVINQRHDIRWPNPERLQVNQSTNVVGRRPFGVDWRDAWAAGW